MKPLTTGILSALLLALASAGFAQAPTETQMRDNADAQQRMQDHNVGKNQKQYFNSLDRNTKGYLNSDDVSADPFLSQNYAKCDADHDGKLTWMEFKSCTHNNPPPPQP
jgi:Ca2+-binding EF-hand superfamily protein